MVTSRSLVTPTSNPSLERALRDRLSRHGESVGSLGQLEPLAVRLGMMQGRLKPGFQDPQLLIFAADHGLAVEGVATSSHSTADMVKMVLNDQLSLTAFARVQGLSVTVVDCGMAEKMPATEGLMMRKIAHGTRNTRAAAAMTLEQAHAGMRAGMQIGEKLVGNATLLAGVGVGAQESAALVLSRLADSPVHELLNSGPLMDSDALARLMAVAKSAQARHHSITEPIEVLAAFGGFEVAVMVGVMLMAASKRHLLMVDGLPACAALMVASRIAQPVTDYCVFCRSHSHRGLDQALRLFRASALLELGLNSIDGTGATLAWPLMKCAAALMAEVADVEGEEAALPAELEESELGSGFDRDSVLPPAFSGPALY